jgi:hypothetical protein
MHFIELNFTLGDIVEMHEGIKLCFASNVSGQTKSNHPCGGANDFIIGAFLFYDGRASSMYVCLN